MRRIRFTAGAAGLIVFALTSPLIGKLGDAKAHPPLIAIGVAVWSVATGGSKATGHDVISTHTQTDIAGRHPFLLS